MVGKYISWGKGGGEHCTVRMGMPKKPEVREREVEASVVKRCPAGLPCSGAGGAGFFPVGEKIYPVLPTNGVHRQNGFKDMGGWRKEPLAKKNRTRRIGCGKTHLKNISLNVYDILLGMGGSPMKLYSSPNADTGSDNADNR